MKDKKPEPLVDAMERYEKAGSRSGATSAEKDDRWNAFQHAASRIGLKIGGHLEKKILKKAKKKEIRSGKVIEKALEKYLN